VNLNDLLKSDFDDPVKTGKELLDSIEGLRYIDTNTNNLFLSQSTHFVQEPGIRATGRVQPGKIL